MTGEQEKQMLEYVKEVREKCKGYYSDDDIMDYCDENDIPYAEAFRFLQEKSVPSCCKGCKNIGMFNRMYPCNACSRNKKDFYEPVE